MRKKIFGLLAAVALFAGSLIAPASVAAASQTYGTGCGTANTYFILHENASGDTSDGADYINICQSVTADALDISHFPSGTCKAPTKIGDDWANCTSSIRPMIRDSQKVLCIYSGWNYDGSYRRYDHYDHNIRDNFPSTFNDTAASFRWVSWGTAC